MKLRVIVFLIFTFFIGIVHADTVRVDGFKARPQVKSNWCWAASIQSIFLTSGLDISQHRLVTAAYGSAVNNTAPGFKGTLKILNGLSVSADGSTWEVRASAGNSFPNANWLLEKLQNDEPVMIWYKDQTSNHSIIVNGGRYYRDNIGNVNWQQISAYDPWVNRNMTIDASNIPRYVYGTFDVELRKVSPLSFVPRQPQAQFGGVCYVQGGACPLRQALPLQSQCYCPSQIGPIYGIVGN